MGQQSGNVGILHGGVKESRARLEGRPPARGFPSRRRRRSGAALLETLLGVMVLMVGLGAGVLSLVTSMALARTAREQSLALQAAESVTEALLATPYHEVFVRYNGTTADDPDPLTGPSPGDSFDVDGLTPWDDEDAVGAIFFPGDNVLLLENVDDPVLGMPRDLDLDTLIDNVDHSVNYRVLPVHVRVRWRGGRGEREISIVTTLVNRAKVTE